MTTLSLKTAADALQRRAATGRRELPAGCQVRPAADPGWVTVTGRCPILDTDYSVKVGEAHLASWQAMQLDIEAAFPYLSPGDREFLLSGFSPAGWAQAFAPEDDE